VLLSGTDGELFGAFWAFIIFKLIILIKDLKNFTFRERELTGIRQGCKLHLGKYQ